MPRSCSLKRDNDISLLFDRGSRFSGRSCAIVWDHRERFAYGIFLSKAFGTAVQRNRAKRLCREALRLELAGTRIPIGVGILPRKPRENLTVDQLRADIRRFLDQHQQTGHQ